MTVDEIQELVARWRETLVRHDTVAYDTAYSDDCVVESPLFGTLIGRAATEKALRNFWSAFPDTITEFGDLLITGHQAAQTAILSGTDTGGFLGQAPTGKPYRLFLVFLLTLRDRHIVRERRIYDVNGLLVQLGTNFGVAADAARVYQATLERSRVEQELKIAAEIQRTLLPAREYEGVGFEVAAASVPCRTIGGDFFYYFTLPDRTFGLALGDVAGKGPPAALLTAVLQGILAGHAHLGATPAETLAHVNQVLVRRAVEARFATVVYASLASDGRLTYCNAGHNPPLLIRSRSLRRLERGGLILGAFREATYEDETVQLNPGDVLVVFSDGVTEAENIEGDQFGDERLCGLMQAHADLAPSPLVECLLETIRQFSAGAVQSDDMTILALRYTGV